MRLTQLQRQQFADIQTVAAADELPAPPAAEDYAKAARRRQKAERKEAAKAEYKYRQKEFGPGSTERRHRKNAKKPLFDLAKIAERQHSDESAIVHFDDLANEAFRSGSLEVAKGYTEYADELAKTATPRLVRHNEFRTAHRAAAKLQAQQAAKKDSRIYGDNTPDNSWVQDVALVRTAQMNAGTYDSRGLGLFQAQALGKDVGWRGPRSQAAERLNAYSAEIRDNVVAGTSFGASAVQYLRSAYRFRGYVAEIDNIEARIRGDIDGLLETRDSVTTIGEDMAYFVPPDYFQKSFALYRTYASPLLNAAGKAPLPSVGFEVLVPVLGSPIGVKAQSEGAFGWYPLTAYAVGSSTLRIVNGQPYLFVVSTAGTSGSTQPNWASALTIGNTISDGSVTWTNTARPSLSVDGVGSSSAPGGDTNYYTPVNTFVGQATVPQQMLDRGVYGQNFDQVIARQAAREIGTAQEADLLYAVLNNANVGSVTTAGTTLYSPTSLLADISSAAENTVVEGTALSPTFIGAKSGVIRGFLKQVSTTGQPIFPINPESEVSPDGVTEGYSGYNIQGARLNYSEQLSDYEDGSAIVLVGNPEQGLLVYESAPVVNCWPQWNGNALTALVNVYTYSAFAVLHGTAFCTIEGAAVYGD